MLAAVPPEPLDAYAHNLIRKKARQLVDQAGLAAHDADDIAQDLVLVLLRRLAAFDATRGCRQAFITLLVNHAVANWLRARRAVGRTPPGRCSLEDAVVDADGRRVRRSATVAEASAHAHRGWTRRTAGERAELAADVATVLAGLPPRLRTLATRLLTQSLADVARDMGVPRTTLATALQQLRHRFERAGLRHYLGDDFVSPRGDRVKNR